jgi:ribonucleoside-diphosphate reductase alpha chain
MSDNDYRWYNDVSKQFLKRDYLLPGQSLDERVRAIAQHAERLSGKKGFAERVIHAVQRGWWSFSTPVWTNYGQRRGLPISCFGTHISDSVASITEAFSEIAMMSKFGGGTSAYFGAIRPQGADIKDNGKAGGPNYFLPLFEQLVKTITQGSTRNASMAVYLDVEHPDIQQFLKIRDDTHPIQNLNYGICVGDEWLESMRGDAEKRDLQAKILTNRNNKGYPYIFFRDNVRRNTVDVYRDKGMEIRHSNLCLSGRMRLLTKGGYRTLRDLWTEQGEHDVTTATSERFVINRSGLVESSSVCRTSECESLYAVRLSTGQVVEATAHHEFVLGDGQRVKLAELNVGDSLALANTRTAFGSVHDPVYAELAGMVIGDGSVFRVGKQQRCVVRLWNDDITQIGERTSALMRECYAAHNQSTEQDPEFALIGKPQKGFDYVRASAQSIVLGRLLEVDGIVPGDKHHIPHSIWNGDKDTVAAFLRGLYTADGSVQCYGYSATISLGQVSRDLLEEVQVLLTQFGIRSSIHPLNKAGKHLMNNGHGGVSEYNRSDSWRLVFSSRENLMLFQNSIGFAQENKNKTLHDWLDTHPGSNNSRVRYEAEVESITYLGDEETFCLNEPKDHEIIINGVVTGNCSEICLPTSDDESFVCCLSSLNLSYWDEWRDTETVADMVLFLDTVITDFIERARSVPFLHRAVKFAERHRALGMGALGWHSLLQSKMIPFESFEAKLLNATIFKQIKRQSWEASKKLAQEYGEPEILKGYGRRNTTLTAIAPTVSSATILGQASRAIEPYLDNYHIVDTAKLKYTFRNEYLQKLLKTYGADKDSVWDSILDNRGSVQHLDFLSEHERAVFKTFPEISPIEVITQAAQRQKELDQSQSLNLFIHPKMSPKDKNAVIMEAWQQGVGTLYYQFNVNAAQEFARESVFMCKSCSA